MSSGVRWCGAFTSAGELPMSDSDALQVDGLTAGYGHLTVLHGVGIRLPQNSAATVIGLNGAGKTTLVRAITGVIRPITGRVEFAGTDITGRPASEIARHGLVTVF